MDTTMLGVKSEGIITADEIVAATLPPSQASTLPPRCYASPEIYDLELERIYRRNWQLVGRVEEVAAPGDYFCIDVANEPLVVVRDRSGRVRILSRVCRHRWAHVIDGHGNTSSFQCPYHAWTYDLDGRLMGAPEMKDTANFDTALHCLPSLPTEVWEGFIFVNLDPQARPLRPELATLSKRLSNYRLDDMQLVYTKQFDGRWNWKVFVDNFNEFYHHLGLHKDTLQDVSPAHHTVVEDTDGPYCFQRLRMTDDGGDYALLPQIEVLTSEQVEEVVLVTLFPNFLLILLANCITYFRVLPSETEETYLTLNIAVPRTSLGVPDFQDRLKTITESTLEFHYQDMAICDAVQSGLKSSMAKQGRLSWIEKSLWQFNQWYLEMMA